MYDYDYEDKKEKAMAGYTRVSYLPKEFSRSNPCGRIINTVKTYVIEQTFPQHRGRRSGGLRGVELGSRISDVEDRCSDLVALNARLIQVMVDKGMIDSVELAKITEDYRIEPPEIIKK